MARKSGVLLHISSLPGEYGIGTLGKDARRFVDFLKRCGFTYWQILPLCMTNSYHSPYQSPASFSGNPFFIDLEVLFAQNLLTDEELLSAKQTTPYSCEFARLKEERLALLHRAYERSDKAVTQESIQKTPALQKLCRFLALQAANDGKPWQEWTVQEPEDLGFYEFLQVTFFQQWAELRNYANERGIRIIGDLPIYVDIDSADVWASPDQFLLNEKGYPSLVAGVPPDYFCADGQLWGNPLYDWSAMEKDGFSWWKERIAWAMTLYDGVRIDHFRGMESYWGVPADATTAKDGQWYKGPGMAVVRAIREVAGDGLIIAEDLGDITDAVRALVQESGFPGMRVLQFAFLSDSESCHHPHHYEPNTVAYSGTHDNNTLLGFLWELPPERRSHVLAYCKGDENDWRRSCGDLIDTLYASSSQLVITPIQDLLAYGSDTRLNRPGEAEGNWSYRVTWEQINELSCEQLYNRNKIYYRL